MNKDRSFCSAAMAATLMLLASCRDRSAGGEPIAHSASAAVAQVAPEPAPEVVPPSAPTAAAPAAAAPPAPPRPPELSPEALIADLKPKHSSPAETLPPAVEAPTLSKQALPPLAKSYAKNVADKPIPRVGAQPWAIDEAWRARHERQVQSPKRASAKLVFLGDSIVDGWGAAPAYREQFARYSPVNLGIAGDYTQNVLWRIEHGVLDGMQPKAVVLLVGINNLAGGFTPEKTAAGVAAVINAVQGRLTNVPVIVLALLPARRAGEDPLRKKIAETNQLLAKLAKPGQVSVHDFGAALLEPDGSISTATSSDALHPTAMGYERLTAALAPVLAGVLR